MAQLPVDGIEVSESLDISAFNMLDGEQQQKVQQIAQGINISDGTLVIQYGSGLQNQIAGFVDTILADIRTKDSGYVGKILTDLMMRVRDIDVDSLDHDSFFSKIPLLGSLLNTVERFINRYQKLETHIENLIDELEKARLTMLKDIAMLDSLFDKNLSYIRELDYYILAGIIKLKEVQEQVLPELKKRVEDNKDPVDAQRYNDTSQAMVRFEKKIHDLRLSRMVSIQTLPQIRLIQNNDQALIEKIQSSILNTIPLWKNQIAIAIALFRQKKTLELQQDVTETTNKLLLKNSEMLKSGSIEVAKEVEEGIVKIETLKQVNSDLISTIDETLRIQKEGRDKRKAAEIELAKIETELKNKLLSIAVPS